MKRAGVVIVGVLILLYSAILAGAAPVSIKNSKHNLSAPDSPTSPGPGPIQSQSVGSNGTSEVCVFCHTPHSGTTDAPLWNRSNPSGPYTPYTSDVMSALSYTVGDSSLGSGKLHVKTRICLSCHDGTIALGTLIAYPNDAPGEIPMLGTTVNKMPTAAAGYLGTDLRDSHPVAVKYTAIADPELKGTITSITPGPGKPIYLYDSNAVKTQATGGTAYIECTSCHDPHDNQYGSFLVGSNAQSGICLSCHNKTGFSSGIHATSTQSYAPPTGAGDSGANPINIGSNVGEVKCMNCHFPHKAGVTPSQPTTPNPSSGAYLLSFQEEASCFNNNDRYGQTSVPACHGASAGAVARNIEGELSKSYRHDVAGYSNLHGSAEARTFQWNGTKHIECADCHNSHTTGNTSRSIGSNAVNSGTSLYGAGGVGVSVWPSPWQPVTVANYTYKEPYGAINVANTSVAYEYEICFKCHSSANQNLSIWNGGWTDQAKEFNPGNGGFHPVAGVNASRFAIPSGSWNAGPLGTFADGNTMYCSDCHGNDGSSPKGPHASSNASLLRYPSFLTTFSTDTSGLSDEATGELCDQCHASAKYYSSANSSGSGFQTSGGVNLHNSHVTKKKGFAYRCVNCHTRIPHGFQRRGMIVVQGDTDESVYSAGGGINTSKITSYSDPGVQSYPTTTGAGTCGTVLGCHQ